MTPAADDPVDDRPEVGYRPNVDGDADPHAPGLGADGDRRTWRRLGYELTHAQSIRDLCDTARRFGWVPPLLVLALHGVVRGWLAYLSEPYAMSQEYLFAGWWLALGINVVYGLFLVGFAWFMYFGVVGGIAGFFSEEAALDLTTFKVGSYLLVVFVPILFVAGLLALTISPPDAVVAGAAAPEAVAETHRAVSDSPQMRLVSVLKAAGWILVGFLVLPVVEELYDVDKRISVLAVLPVTLAAVVSTQLV